MRNFIDFTKNGGYRFKQYTLRLMQEAYLQILKMFVAFCNIPEVGNFIISGCIVSGPNITAGYLYIDGELCRFEQAAGTAATKIKKNVAIETLAFFNGINEPVIRKVNAIVHLTDGSALSEFIRVSPVFDANYVHTDNNFEDIDLAHLDSIEPGAQVNVQANWTQTDDEADDFIKNKPTGQLLTYLRKGNFPIADPGTDTLVTIPFGVDLGTSSYMVLGTLVSEGSDYNIDNDIIMMVRAKTATSFKLCLREMSTAVQDLSFDYVIIPF